MDIPGPGHALSDPFLIWGASLEEAFSVESAITWLTAFERWAWAAAIGLFLLDFLLPIPATAVMSALGYIYGPLWGGLIGGGGSFVSGLAAYGLCRWLGPKAAERLLGERDYQRGRKLFAGAGGWIIVISRWLPLLPEVVACMAGLTRMPIGKLVLAMACGSLPLGFAFAYIGHTGSAHPLLAIGLSAGIPPILWFFARHLLRRQTKV